MMKQFLCAFFIFFAAYGQLAARDFTTLVSVELELESMSDARLYQMEVRKIYDKKNSTKKFSQAEPVFRIRLEVGSYVFRTRFVSIDNEEGPWSPWAELLARPEQVSSLQTSSYNWSVAKNQPHADVDLKWEPTAGAEKYIVWIEDAMTKTVLKETVTAGSTKVKLKAGEYRVGVQAVAKGGLRSPVRYLESRFFVAKTRLPRIEVVSRDFRLFKWPKESESDVKIDIYRKAFFAKEYSLIQSVKEAGAQWILPKESQPGEYRIEFQYVSETFENGPLQTLNFIKKPDESDFESH